MKEKDIKLHIGCGFDYLPGYINIDIKGEVADLIMDASDLSAFEDNSVSEIVSYHLIEHIDYIKLKFILSEWFRVLKPQGRLIIETPDIEKSFLEFLISNEKKREEILRWIFGVGDLLLSHKFCFDKKMIKKLLMDVGFTEIKFEKAIKYSQYPSIRVRCKKPKKLSRKKLFEISFRSWFIRNYKNVEIYEIYSVDEAILDLSNYNTYDEIKIRVGICNESLLKFFSNEETLPKNMQEKIFYLWMNYKKEEDLYSSYVSFIRNIVKRILTLLKDGKVFDYFSEIPEEKIRFFGFSSIDVESKKYFGLGIKEFSNRNYERAVGFLMKSFKVNPFNYLVCWNLGRLFRIIHDIYKSNFFYKRALELCNKNLNIKRKIIKEIKSKKIEECPLIEGNLL